MSTSARVLVVAALGCVLAPRVLSDPFAPMQAAGPASARDMLTYEANIDAWVFVDFFAGIHDRMFVQVCAGPALACPSKVLAVFGNCSELTRTDAASAWRSVERLPHDCARAPVATPMRAEMPNRIVIANRIEDMRALAQPRNASDGSCGCGSCTRHSSTRRRTPGTCGRTRMKWCSCPCRRCWRACSCRQSAARAG